MNLQSILGSIGLKVCSCLLICLVTRVSGSAETRSFTWSHFDSLAELQSRIGPGEIWANIGSRSTARAFNDSALASARSDSTSADSIYIHLLNHRGDYYFQEGNFLQADSIWRMAGNIFARGDPGSLLNYEPSLLRIGIGQLALKKNGRDTSFRSAIDFLNALRNTPLPGQEASLYRLGFLYDKLNKYPQADSCLRKVVTLTLESQDSDPFFAIRTLVYLAENESKVLSSNVMNAGKLQDSAIALGTLALSLAEAAYGLQDTVVAFVLNRLGDYYSRQGLLITTDSLWIRAFNINSGALPEEHIEYQGSLDRMGTVLTRSGRLTEAESMRRRSLALRSRTQGPAHPEVASMMVSLGRLLLTQRRYAEAESLFIQGLAIRAGSLSRNHPDIASSLMDLGNLYAASAQFVKAEYYYEKALAMRKKVLGSKHESVASSLESIGNLYEIWNRPQDALNSFKHSLAIRQGFLGAAHPSLAGSLLRIAAIEEQQERPTVALGYYHDALGIVDRSRGSSSDLHWELIADIATLESSLQESATVEKQLGDAWQATRSHADSTSGNPRILSRLIAYYISHTDLTIPETVLNETRQYLLCDSIILPAKAAALEQLTRYLLLKDNPMEALLFARRALSSRLRHFDDASQALSEFHLVSLNQRLLRARDLFISACLAAEPTPDEYSTEIAWAISETHSGTLDAIKHRRDRLTRNMSPAERLLSDSLQFIRRQLANQFIASYGSTSDIQATEISQLSTLKVRLESKLGRLAAENQPEGLGSNSRDRSLLEANLIDTCAVVFTKFHFASRRFIKDSPYYLAVVKNGNRPPQVTILAPDSVISRIMVQYVEHFDKVSKHLPLPTVEDCSAFQTIGGDLRTLVWDPIDNSVASARQILISADDALALLTFASLPAKGGGYLGEQLGFEYLTSLREDENSAEHAPTGRGLLAFGGLDYGSRDQIGIIAKQDMFDHELGFPLLVRGAVGGCDSSFIEEFAPLPGAEREVVTLGELWRARDESVTVMVGADGTEEAFKRMTRGQRILHLATHGFFLDQNCRIPEARLNSMGSPISTHDPMLLSGLAFAGANVRSFVSQVESPEDGILTAEEVVDLDLTGVDLVVVSACESGKGLWVSGGGNYGLRRAFSLAGASRMVSSLWTVSDNITVKLIKLFYEHLDLGPSVSLQEAQLTLLRNQRSKGLPDHPITWAPFIVSR